MPDTPENQQQYGSLLTILGENAEQNGKLQNKAITFTHIAIGNANDSYVQPDRTQNALVNELARIPVNSVDILQPTPESVPMLKVEAILPDNVNDIVIRELAAVAEFNGQSYFHAIGNCARIYVPPPVNNGNVLTPVTLEMIFVITSAEPIIEIDPNVVTASRDYVNQTLNDSLKQTSEESVYPPFSSVSLKVGDVIPGGTTAVRFDGKLWYLFDSNIDDPISVESLADNNNGTLLLNDSYLFVKKEIHEDLKSRTINIKNYGAAEYPFDSTDALILATSFLKSGFRFDFNGMNIKIVHKGVNSNPFNPIDSPNQTTYLFAEKLHGLYFQNGSLICEDLDMSKDSLNMVGLAGCRNPIFDNFHIVLIAHGIPQFSVNGFETFASLIFHQHHLDGTKASGLQIRPNCSFKIFHPNGGSIGPKDGNPTHDYSGKLAGILNYGNVAAGDDGIISNFWCEGAYFWECTARVIWCWHSKGNHVNKNHFFRCGESADKFCNYGIRVTHYGSDSSYDDNVFEECHFTSAGILVSNNNSPRTPKNYSVSRNKATNCTSFDIGINAGVNAKIDSNQFENVVASFGHIRFIQQVNSEWKSVSARGNKGTNVSTFDPSNEGSGFIYSSADAAFEIDIEDTVVDGVAANGAITVRYYPQNIRRSNLKNCSGYGIYHGSGMAGAEYSDNTIEGTGNWAIGGYSDTKFKSFNAKIKNCNKGMRLGNGSEAYGGSIDNCESTHLELRTNTIVKSINISDGQDTISGTSAVLHMEGGPSKLIESLTINSSGRFGYGVRSIFKSYLVNVGVLGSYINQDIDVDISSIKINCYNELGEI